MQSLVQKIEAANMKKQVVDVKSGDTVRVHQKIKEGSKERVQVFEGLVIRTKRRASVSSSITVRRISSGIGVEKSFMLHSPLITKIEVVKRSDVNRNYLTYMRDRSGKSARLESVEFDRNQVNEIEDEAAEEVADVEKAEDKAQKTEKVEEVTKEKTEDVADEAKEAKAEETEEATKEKSEKA